MEDPMIIELSIETQDMSIPYQRPIGHDYLDKSVAELVMRISDPTADEVFDGVLSSEHIKFLEDVRSLLEGANEIPGSLQVRATRYDGQPGDITLDLHEKVNSYKDKILGKRPYGPNEVKHDYMNLELISNIGGGIDSVVYNMVR